MKTASFSRNQLDKSVHQTGKICRAVLICISLLVVLLPSQLFAQSLGRNVLNGTWEEASEWVDENGNTGNLPTGSSDVFIGSSNNPHTSAVANATVSLSSAGFANSVTIGQGAGNSGMLTLQPGGSLTASDIYLGGFGGIGVLNLGAQQVILSGGFNLWSGGSVNRTTGGITADSFSVSEASFTIAGSDNFSSWGNVSGGGSVTNEVALNLSSGLNITGTGSSFTANDTVQAGSIGVSSNSIFNNNANVSTDDIFFLGTGSTLNLNSGTLAVGFSFGAGSATINRNGGSLTADSFSLNNTSLTYLAGDNFVSFGSLSNGSLLKLEQDLSLTDSLSVNNSTLDLGANMLTVGGTISFGSTLIREAGSLIEAGGLDVSGGSDFQIFAGDLINSSIALGFGDDFGTLTVTQMPGELTGLTFLGNSLLINSDNDSAIHLIFDGIEIGQQLDWAFRWSGDRVSELNSLLGNQILVSGAPLTVSVIRDVNLFGDFTYIGYISPIPEPNSILLFSVVGFYALTRRVRIK